MSDLTYLIRYLAEENRTDANIPVERFVRFDDNLINNDFFYLADGNSIFSGIDSYNIITITLRNNQSLWYRETTSDFIFYIKQTINDGGVIVHKYHELNTNSTYDFDFTILEDTDNLFEIPVSNNTFKYNTYLNILYLIFEELDEVVFDGNKDNFYYKRVYFKEITNGVHELNYKDSLGLYNDFWDNATRKVRETNLNIKQRRLTITFDENKEGYVFKFPIISKINTTTKKITLDYNFDNDEPIIKNRIFNTNFAFRLDFNSYQAFLSFCNQVYFSNDITFDLNIFPKVERQFFEDYHYIITQLIKDAKRSSRSLADLLDILWYLPRTYIQTKIGIGFLWDLLIQIIEEDDINNLGLNKEDLVTYILSNLSERLQPDDFLEIFLLKLVNSKETPFKRLFEELNTDDFKSFVNLFWSVWSKSSYASFDPKVNPAISENEEEASPLVLPYTTDKTFGFYDTNASIDFTTKETELSVALKVDSGKTKKVKIAKNRYSKKTIYNYYNYKYHIFHPVAISNDKNPKFIYNKSEGRKFTVLPAFVLLANEESAFWENLKTGGEYLLDAVTTLSGIGNLAKFRHLSKLVKLGHKLVLAQKVKKAVTGFAAITEISSGTINILLKLSGLNDTKFGQSLSEVLFYLELLSLGGELANGLKNAAKKVLKSDDLGKHIDNLVKKGEIDELDKINFHDELKRIVGDYVEEISVLRIVPDLKNAAEVKLFKELRELFIKKYTSIIKTQFRQTSKLLLAWKNLDVMNALSKSEIDDLLRLRTQFDNVKSDKNMATMIAIVEVNGKKIKIPYTSLSGLDLAKGNAKYIETSKFAENLGLSKKEANDLFRVVDSKTNRHSVRINDTEHKMLLNVSEDIDKLKAIYGVDNVRVLGMEMKTLYLPCHSCKRQIIIYSDMLNIPKNKIKVQATQIGKNEYAENAYMFNKFLSK
ncbi:hypothetical protein U8527_07530 [Kordia algicida OT-1]|uniref:Uncharacterized protein n=1 Tax=Kordia algicida OT-1 TaxID=391587 RepID=A9EDS2_9FLAO|nr:hypothetical protein [Kordia algicida]EDP94216.1 hypothetical protein KAOT1_00960 [Kordia algicida OT-1]